MTAIVKSQGLRLSVPYDTQRGSVTLGSIRGKLIVLGLAKQLQRQAPVTRHSPVRAEIDPSVVDLKGCDRALLRPQIFAPNPARAEVGAQAFGQLTSEIQ